MSKKEGSGGKKNINEGYVPNKRGYQPNEGSVTGGHKPEKSELKPINPPKKK
jgi:hypothetical protein